MNEREAPQGRVVTARPPKRLAQVRSSLMSDPLPVEADCEICQSRGGHSLWLGCNFEKAALSVTIPFYGNRSKCPL